jgi:hypothetical protein
MKIKRIRDFHPKKRAINDVNSEAVMTFNCDRPREKALLSLDYRYEDAPNTFSIHNRDSHSVPSLFSACSSLLGAIKSAQITVWQLDLAISGL